jgi:tetratricopeptide (TPR) repeat protein
MPFYHVIPDPYDCLRAFGGDRGLRYVCQENLQEISAAAADDHSSTNIDVELEDWEWVVDSKGVRTYQPPASLLYKYAQEQDGNETERCINQLLETINIWQYQACTDTMPDDSVAASWTMDNFLLLLRHADSLEDATSIQELIKEIRKAHTRLELRWKLERGIAKLMSGEATQALEIFESVVADDPNFTEGWNKLATCEFMLGKYDESEVWTHKTLELDPNHFQSMNGLGLIYFQKNHYQKAVDCFRKSLNLDPWSPVASKLSTALDLLSQQDKIPADESST